jgi:hypothetical protein
MNQLVRYETARNALAECQRVDEVKDIRDKAEAMAAYARQAKDTELIQFATEIKVRAERKCGELLAQTVEHGGDRKSDSRSDAPTLNEMGITKDQSSRYQQLAAMPDEHFETAVETAKSTAGEVTTAFMLREAQKIKPRGKPITGKKADAIREELKAAQPASMLCTYARLAIGIINSNSEFTEQERQAIKDLRTAIDRLSINLEGS